MKRRHFLTSATLAAAAPTLGLLTPASALASPLQGQANYVGKYAFSDALFEVNPTAGTSTYLTMERWKALGYAQPVVKGFLPGTKIIQFKGLDTLYAQLGPVVQALSFEQWKATNYAKPLVVTPDAVKYPWQDDVYAVYFTSAARETWIWQHLSLQQWTALGQPKPRNAGWIHGTVINSVPGRNDIVYSTLGDVHHELTFDQWAGMGAPKPAPLKLITLNPSYATRYTRMSEMMRDNGFILDVTYGTFSSRKVAATEDAVVSTHTAKVVRVVNGQNIPFTVKVRFNGGIDGGNFVEVATEKLPREGSREIIFCTYNSSGEFVPHWQGRFPVVNGQLQNPNNIIVDLKVI